MTIPKPLQRREKPDFDRFLKVIRREGDRGYVPFFELCMDPAVFEPLSGLRPPVDLNFMPTSPTFEPTFQYYLNWCAATGFDHGTINICGFTGFPTRRVAERQPPGRNFAQAGDGIIRTDGDFETYPWPTTKTVDVDAMERTARLAPEGLSVMTGGPAVFQTLQDIFGVQALSILLYDDPELVQRVADRIGSILVELYDLVASLPFIRGVLVSGDMGFKTGTLVSPESLRRLVFPWHTRICEAIHRHGKIAILHSCGNLAAVMGDIVGAGFDAKHSFEDAIEPSLYELHERWGDRICLIGGVDVDFLCRADEAAIRARVREMIDRLAPGGGWILGSGNSIPNYMPVEKFWIMLDEGLKYGRP